MENEVLKRVMRGILKLSLQVLDKEVNQFFGQSC